MGRHGDLYGTTTYGGAHGWGTVFKINRSGFLTTLYNFCELPGCADGQYVSNGLTFGRDGELYGVTSGGGKGAGNFFQITRKHQLVTLHKFCSLPNCADGGEPLAGVVLANDGNFYGTTYIGGANGRGTIFRITPKGRLTTLYSFCPTPDCPTGQEVDSPLIQATDGNFYGTASLFGAYDCGTVFQVTPAGEVTTVHSFDNFYKTEGCNPAGGLLQASDGNLYGTTSNVDFHNGAGTIFTIGRGNTFKTLYTFNDHKDGANPFATLIQGRNGSLYGTTYFGGDSFDGTVFEFSPAGVFTVLHSFENSTDGSLPRAPLVQSCNGDLYGAATTGGNLTCDGYIGCGTIFRLVP